MRIAFDVTAQIAGSTGIARYQSQLAAALERAGVTVDRFAIGRASHPVPTGTRHLRVPGRLVYPAWRWFGQPSLRWIVREADLVHGGAPVVPPARVPVVTTVHDLDALDYPELHPDRSSRDLRSLVATLGRATMVIAVSNHVAGSLRSRGLVAKQVAVVPNGVTRLPDPVTPPLREPYVLAVGELMPRKGFDILLSAFARSARAVRDGYRLVIVGPRGIAAPRLDDLCGRLGLTSRVLFTGPVGDAELAGYYTAAAAVCVPSRAEGFGLPLLEAMAAGCPAVASDLPVLREVSGGHALFVPVGDEPAWALALERILSDEVLARELRSKGKDWANRFTWDRAAAETVAVYEQALAAAGRAT